MQSLPVTVEINSITFSLYSRHDIHHLSVVRVTEPVIFDHLRRPVKGGLYDPLMGAMENLEICQTCSLSYQFCPGHLGRIELPLPVFNPLHFPLLHKTLRSMCFFCHHFRISRDLLLKFRTQFLLLQAGRVADVVMVGEYWGSVGRGKGKAKVTGRGGGKKGGGKSKGSDGESDDESEGGAGEIDDIMSQALKQRQGIVQRLIKEAETLAASSTSSTSSTSLSTHILDLRRTLIGQFLRAIPSKKCANCHAPAINIRKGGNSKLFQIPLNKRQRQFVESLGLALVDVTAALVGAKTVVDDDVDGDVEDDVDDSSASSSSSSSSLSLSLEDEKVESKTSKTGEFLSPLQAEEHIKRLWKTEESIVHLVWPGARESGIDMFFLNIVAVPPNRFCPLAMRGEEVVEHPQNTYLTRTLNVCQQLNRLSQTTTTPISKQIELWLELQEHLNGFIDSSRTQKGEKDQPMGIRQILEKKEGLFRRNMMGKRVNYAARSVISPDPYLATNEIGVPLYFAINLSYRECVSSYNVKELRQAVINGPDVHPGACFIEDDKGNVINLSGRTKQQRIALSRTLQKPSLDCNRPKRVGRHLQDGDYLLVNRQPTLHKPGIMAHKVKVLKKEKTIRMHYANCNTYNADFDGDEINLHFPQNELGRAEAAVIANADQQYIVPTSGKPLRGLIQDHVVAGVMLTMKDMFLTRGEFQQLLDSALTDVTTSFRFETPIPALIRRYSANHIYYLWTGKQLISCLLNHLTRGKPQFNLSVKTKVPGHEWGPGHDLEGTLIIRQNDMLTGVLEKSQFGATEYGLVHSVQELYGGEMAGRLLTSLGRLLSLLIQNRTGFTCGIDDLLLTPESEVQRRLSLSQSLLVGETVAKEFLNISKDTVRDIRPLLQRKLRGQSAVEASGQLDTMMKGSLNPITGQVINTSFATGLFKKFPWNNMSMMTVSGAKGSPVNQSQISCLLGQQELEGRRVPRTITGRTLPSFQAYDPSARAGGYICDRFLTGIRPQEYYFHCMAGREGLVDTAVKTSRSGYLQRCVIKHLEGIRVHYDGTVRDGDGSVIQFYYGEDGIDTMKTKYLNQFSFIASNVACYQSRLQSSLQTVCINTNVINAEKPQDQNENDPTLSRLNPYTTLGVVSNSFIKAVEEYIKTNPRHLINTSTLSPALFRQLMWSMYQRCLADPGEMVGIVAGQSIGEPSTQMTLNTFHLAGHGGANVTLGIPRLREIVMTASVDLKTPAMTIPLLPPVNSSRPVAESIAESFDKLLVADRVEKIIVMESLKHGAQDSLWRHYTIRLNFFNPKECALKEDKYAVSKDIISKIIEGAFSRRLLFYIFRELRRADAMVEMDGGKRKKLNVGKRNEDGEGLGDEGEGENTGKKDRRNINDDDDDDDDDASSASSLHDDDGGNDGEIGDAKQETRTAKHISGNYEENNDKDDESDNESDDESDDGSGSESDDDDPDISLSPMKDIIYDPNEAVIVKVAAQSMKKSPLECFRFAENGKWCEIVLQLPSKTRRLLMTSIVERVCGEVPLVAVPGIKRGHVLSGSGAEQGTYSLQTEGVNFEHVWCHPSHESLDINNIHTNDIGAVLRTFGVEAARKTIVREINAVFGVYGIAVDTRHLNLVADYMTFLGGFRAMNRIGIESNPSPLLKMSFETTARFLSTSTLGGDVDDLQSPSSRIVAGRVPAVGSGCFDIMQPLE